MRISTQFVYQRGIDAISQQQSDLLRTQQQIATGRRLLTPADDPVAAGQALNVAQAKALLGQYSANVNTAQGELAYTESVLSGYNDLLHDVRTLLVQAGTASLAPADRQSIARDLQGRLDQLIGLANSTNGSGRFLFAGFQENVQPFTLTAAGVAYNGDEGQRSLQVGPGRQIAVTENGSTVFMKIKNGNGTFVATPATTNTGSGLISPGTVVNPTALTGNDYRVQFTVVGSTITYDVINVTTSTTIISGAPYVENQAITFDGLQVQIKGTPANGDQFNIVPSTNQSIFTTLQNAINVLQNPGAVAPDTVVANGVSLGLQNIDQALEKLLTVRGGVGARLRELDALLSGNEAQDLHYAEQLSKLVDLDYAQAISDFTRQQIALEAAQKSYVGLTKLSLFNFI